MATTADQRAKPDDHRLLSGPSTPFPIPKKCTNRRSVYRHSGDRAPPSLPPDVMSGGNAAFGGDDDRRLDELRAKLMGHLREAADRMKVSVSGAPPAAETPPPPPPPPSSSIPSEAAATTERPWNLRTRRKPPPSQASPSPAPAAAVPTAERVKRNTRSRSEAAAAAATEEEGKRKLPLPKVTIALTAEEIEEDIYAISGSRPRRRPKKRPRALQLHLDMFFPGLWLSEITEELYKVEDE